MPTFKFEAKTLGLNEKIKTYDTVGHEHPREIKIEIVEFFREAYNNN